MFAAGEGDLPIDFVNVPMGAAADVCTRGGTSELAACKHEYVLVSVHQSLCHGLNL